MRSGESRSKSDDGSSPRCPMMSRNGGKNKKCKGQIELMGSGGV